MSTFQVPANLSVEIYRVQRSQKLVSQQHAISSVKITSRDVFLLIHVTVPTPDGEITLLLSNNHHQPSALTSCSGPTIPAYRAGVRNPSMHLKRSNCRIIFKSCRPFYLFQQCPVFQLSAPRSKGAAFDTQYCSEGRPSSISLIQV